MRTLSLVINLVIGAFVSLAVSSCTGSTTSDSDLLSAGVQTGLIPAVADLESLPREPSVHNTEITLGSSFRWRSDNTMIAGSVMALMGGVANPSWVIYELDTINRTVISVGVETGSDDGEVYLALTNFDSNTWEYSAPVSIPDTYLMEVSVDNINSGNGIFVLAAVAAGVSGSVSKVELTVDEPGWNIYTLDDRTGAGRGVDLFVQDGKPMLAFATHNLGGVNYWRSTTEFPTSPAQWVGMAAAGGPDPEEITPPLAAALIDGRPGVLYKESTEEIVRYVYSTVAEPSEASDWVSHDLHDAHYVSQQVSLVELDGVPCALYGYTTYTNHFAKATTSSPAGAADWDFTSISASEDEASLGKMAVVGNRPVVVCSGDFGEGAGAYYVRATTSSPTGPDDWVAELMYGFQFAGTRASVVSRPVKPTSYRPLAAYLNDPALGGLVLSSAKIPIPTTTSDWHHFFIDNDITRCSVYTADARPFLAYYNGDDERFMSIWSSVPSPDSNEDLQYLMIKNGPVGYFDCISIEGTPVIAYQDTEEDCLKFGFYEE